MTTTYELYTNENGTPKAVEGKAPAILERVEALEGTLDNGVVTSVNSQTGDVTVDVGVTSFNGSKGAVTYSAPVSSVNGKTGAVTVDVGVTSVNGQTGSVTVGTVRSVNGVNADPSGNVALQLGGGVTKVGDDIVVKTTGSSTTSSTQKTITGVVPYKPTFVVVKGISDHARNYVWPYSGVIGSVPDTSAFDAEMSQSSNLIYASRAGGEYIGVCIPTGSSFVLRAVVWSNSITISIYQ